MCYKQNADHPADKRQRSEGIVEPTDAAQETAVREQAVEMEEVLK